MAASSGGFKASSTTGGAEGEVRGRVGPGSELATKEGRGGSRVTKACGALTKGMRAGPFPFLGSSARTVPCIVQIHPFRAQLRAAAGPLGRRGRARAARLARHAQLTSHASLAAAALRSSSS